MEGGRQQKGGFPYCLGGSFHAPFFILCFAKEQRKPASQSPPDKYKRLSYHILNGMISKSNRSQVTSGGRASARSGLPGLTAGRLLSLNSPFFFSASVIKQPKESDVTTKGSGISSGSTRK